MYGIVVEPGKNSRIIIEKVNDLKLRELYRLTDCDCIAIGSIKFNLSKILGFKLNLVFDDEFLLRDGEKIINKLCSYLYGYTLHKECLCGKVAIVKSSEADDDFEPFTEEEAKKVKELLEKIALKADKEEYVLHKPGMIFYGAEQETSNLIYQIIGNHTLIDFEERLDENDE